MCAVSLLIRCRGVTLNESNKPPSHSEACNSATSVAEVCLLGPMSRMAPCGRVPVGRGRTTVRALRMRLGRCDERDDAWRRREELRYVRGRFAERRGMSESVPGQEAEIGAVLAGLGAYDDLEDSAQAIVRAVWEERIAASRNGLNLAAEFRATGITNWVTADEQGRTVIQS